MNIPGNMQRPPAGPADKFDLGCRFDPPEIFTFTVDFQPAFNPDVLKFPERDISPFGVLKVTA